MALPAPATGPPGEVACPRHRLLRALYYLPAISSLVVISLAWRYLLDQRGPINNLLSSWGFDTIPFLSNQWLILFCAMIITLWQGLPYYMTPVFVGPGERGQVPVVRPPKSTVLARSAVL